MWKLQEAVDLIQELEPKVRSFNYHTCLGGSVLHKGFSDNDLDIFILPIDESNIVPDSIGLEAMIRDLFYGVHYPISKAGGYLHSKRVIFEAQHGDKKVNIFIYS